MKNKNSNKLTNREIQYHLSKLYEQDSQVSQVINGVGNMFYNYLAYKGEKESFAKFCKEQQPKEKDEQNK